MFFYFLKAYQLDTLSFSWLFSPFHKPHLVRFLVDDWIRTHRVAGDSLARYQLDHSSHFTFDTKPIQITSTYILLSIGSPSAAKWNRSSSISSTPTKGMNTKPNLLMCQTMLNQKSAKRLKPHENLHTQKLLLHYTTGVRLSIFSNVLQFFHQNIRNLTLKIK